MKTLVVVQNVLLLVGLTVLGAVLTGPGVWYAAVLTIFRPPPHSDPSLAWGAAYAMIPCFACGGALGAVVGFIIAVRWMDRRRSRPWKWTTWAGIALGLVLGLAIRYFGPISRYAEFGGLYQTWPATIGLITATATLGGLIGAGVASLWPRLRK
jgi:hypothetical protein